MTLREMVKGWPELFYRSTWYVGEPFMDRKPTGTVPPDFFVSTLQHRERPKVSAADLAALYIKSPDDPRWRRFLWTDDYDSHGQQVYVGGVGEFGINAFQIHRHLRVTSNWGWVA